MQPKSWIRHAAAGLALAAGLVRPAFADPVLTLPAVQDANIADGFWASLNLNAVEPRFVMVNWGCSDCTTSQGLIQFDLTGVNDVGYAELWLYHQTNSAAGRTFNLYRTVSAWDETTVTYDTRPAVDPAAVATLIVDPEDTAMAAYRAWIVTELVQGWVGGAFPNFGVTLREQNERPTDWVFFGSRENPEGRASAASWRGWSIRALRICSTAEPRRPAPVLCDGVRGRRAHSRLLPETGTGHPQTGGALPAGGGGGVRAASL